MKIIIGSDDFVVALKKTFVDNFLGGGYEIVDYNPELRDGELYPDIAVGVAQRVLSGEFERGILICGTGAGMCVAANKVPGIRAVVCHDAYTAQRACKSNNAQIACFGSAVLGEEQAKALLDIWLDSEFAGGRSLPKVERIEYYDTKFRAGI